MTQEKFNAMLIQGLELTEKIKKNISEISMDLEKLPEEEMDELAKTGILEELTNASEELVVEIKRLEKNNKK